MRPWLGSLRRRSAHGRERGAAALEFALVLPLLLLLVLGGIDYGLFINDSMVVRDAARNAARAGAIGDFASQSDCDQPDPLDQVACSAVGGASGATGVPSVLVVGPDEWVRGEPLVVCVELDERAKIGLVPMPSGGNVRVKVEFAVESVLPETVLTPLAQGRSGPTPPGGWGWCTS